MKWHGVVGIGVQEEDPERPSVYKNTIVEKEYTGEIFNRTISYRTGENVHTDLEYGQSVSILADPYLMQFYSSIAYVTIDNQKWNVSRVSVEYPRLKLDVGSGYIDERGTGSSSSGFTYGV